jgi:uncharacterized membrane protein
MAAITTVTGEDRASRWLMLGSLALNLFLVGVGGALLIGHFSAPTTEGAPIDRSVVGRIDRIAASLPAADAAIFRATFKADADRIVTAQAALRQQQDAVRGALRAEPFDLDAMRAAMTNTRAARQSFEVILHDMVATAAAKMSVGGRNKLADWPPTRDNSATAPRK